VVAHEILECVLQGSDMNELGKFYVDHLIRLCMLLLHLYDLAHLFASSAEQRQYPYSIGSF